MTGQVSMCESCWKKETHVIVWRHKAILALMALECFVVGRMRRRKIPGLQIGTLFLAEGSTEVLDLCCEPTLEVLCGKEVVGGGARRERLGLGVVCDVVDDVIAAAKVLKTR